MPRTHRARKTPHSANSAPNPPALFSLTDLDTAAHPGADRFAESAEAATPREKAQELCWNAMDAPDGPQPRRWVKEALALDPECVDALVMQAAWTRSQKTRIEMLERAVVSGHRRLGGDSYFAEWTGHFWSLVETRPYMRARINLAIAYKESGRTLDAISAFEEMLRLCPDDNPGNRDILLGLYLRCGEKHRAQLLLRRYGPDSSAVSRFGQLIIAIQSDDRRAERLFLDAQRQNPYVVPGLLGARNLPAPGAFYGIGDEAEAAYCLECLMDAFLSHPRIPFWIAEHALPRP